MPRATAAPARLYGGLAADERRARRRARLLEGGLELIGKGGWQATTVTAVCKRARLTPRYFYESFGDRDDLLVAIFDAIVGEVAEEVGRVLAERPRDLRATVRATIAAWVKISTDDPRKGRAVFVEALGGSETLMSRRMETSRRFSKLLASEAREHHRVSSRQAGALDVATFMVAGGLIHTMIEWLEHRLDVPPEQVIEDYTALCLACVDAALAAGGRSG